MKFPYYIVRFKRMEVCSRMTKRMSFHTTQYDLNIAFEGFWRRWEQSFHTTQYDLNDGVCYSLLCISMFPYYIVRFKHHSLRPAPTNPEKFPYYIVRFKRGILNQRGKKPPSFHTTQYDLNGVHNVSAPFSIEFPYYIVRFKPS